MADEMKKNLENEEIELDALEDVNGGYTTRDPGIFWQARVKFYPEDIQKLREQGYTVDITPAKEYTRGEVNQLLGLDAGNQQELINLLGGMGLRYQGKHGR